MPGGASPPSLPWASRELPDDSRSKSVITLQSFNAKAQSSDETFLHFSALTMDNKSFQRTH
jgi:hypothetical protein